ncbi:MAG: acyl-CoA synthetase [Actinomycetota bacterium]|nr:acyl-CoA synthetase [Actinomycetota bacterium]
MTYNLADLFEQVVDAVPDREAFVVGERRLTYRELDRRANRLAHVLADRGVGPGDRVGLQLVNGSEYLEGMLAAFKLRAVPINVNYRYVEGELRHLFADAGLVALVLHASFAERVAVAAVDVAALHVFLVVADGSDASALGNGIDYETAMAAASTERDFEPRSDDDLYCVYTGGTTGLPKGVLWRHEDIFFAAMGGGDPFQTGDWITEPSELVDRLPEVGMVALPIPPFMHASAHWLAFHQLFGGGKIVVAEGGGFDPAAIWELVGREKVNTVVIVGDAMARPLCDELVAHPDRYDTSSLLAIGSGGAILSPSTKAQIAELLPGRFVVDSYGSSETGTVGGQGAFEGKEATGPKLRLDDRTAVLDDDLQPVEAGSQQIGRLARSGHVPIGYHGDEEKSAATFVTHGGRRWVIPGDMATVDLDGTINLLGRGSVSINTGGEKVFPEEVEAALKAHPDVLDAVVVGVPDDRWGERVVAIVQPRAGTAPSLEDLQAHGRAHLAGYKLPRELVEVGRVVRSPSGKADYRWAKDVALTSIADGAGQSPAAAASRRGEQA